MSFYLTYAIIVDPQLVGLKVGCYIKDFSRILNNDISRNKAVDPICFYKERCYVADIKILQTNFNVIPIAGIGGLCFYPDLLVTFFQYDLTMRYFI